MSEHVATALGVTGLPETITEFVYVWVLRKSFTAFESLLFLTGGCFDLLGELVAVVLGARHVWQVNQGREDLVDHMSVVLKDSIHSLAYPHRDEGGIVRGLLAASGVGVMVSGVPVLLWATFFPVWGGFSGDLGVRLLLSIVSSLLIYFQHRLQVTWKRRGEQVPFWIRTCIFCSKYALGKGVRVFLLILHANRLAPDELGKALITFQVMELVSVAVAIARALSSRVYGEDTGLQVDRALPMAVRIALRVLWVDLQIPLAQDRAALLGLYSATSGPSWTIRKGWGESVPLGKWHGVTADREGRVVALDLRSNNLKGEIPAVVMGGLTALRELRLFDNQLTGAIPADLGELTALTWLDLSGNELNGSIPSELCGLTALQKLSLHENQLSGTIPRALGGLKSLTYLGLYNNQLTGGIPAELGELTALQTLGLENNQLSGRIPTELGSLTDLKVLDLHENQLTGSIPSELCGLTALQMLYLHENQLSGSIPSELGGLTALQKLALLGNQLSGAIPRALGELKSLTYLGLHKNKLTGSIPSELCGLTALQMLYLHGNQLSGSIPSELCGLIALQKLSLHENQLSGAIPRALGGLKSLTHLFLYNNQLTGAIPRALGGLKSLTHIFLDSNKLTGMFNSFKTVWADSPATPSSWRQPTQWCHPAGPGGVEVPDPSWSSQQQTHREQGGTSADAPQLWHRELLIASHMGCLVFYCDLACPVWVVDQHTKRRISAVACMPLEWHAHTSHTCTAWPVGSTKCLER